MMKKKTRRDDEEEVDGSIKDTLKSSDEPLNKSVEDKTARTRDNHDNSDKRKAVMFAISDSDNGDNSCDNDTMITMTTVMNSRKTAHASGTLQSSLLHQRLDKYN
uniref:Uncharacterized protein n=1 Tax=Setaria digitata TaxID=48799 RepID=A0A915PL27_9BILA